jgi:hypothetical protein
VGEPEKGTWMNRKMACGHKGKNVDYHYGPILTIFIQNNDNSTGPLENSAIRNLSRIGGKTYL